MGKGRQESEKWGALGLLRGAQGHTQAGWGWGILPREHSTLIGSTFQACHWCHGLWDL